jgi:hypothetical protein
MRLTSESIYFRDINRYPLLTDKEERDLVRKVQLKKSKIHLLRGLVDPAIHPAGAL